MFYGSGLMFEVSWVRQSGLIDLTPSIQEIGNYKKWCQILSLRGMIDGFLHFVHLCIL